MPERAALRRGFLSGLISGYASVTVCVPDPTNPGKMRTMTDSATAGCPVREANRSYTWPPRANLNPDAPDNELRKKQALLRRQPPGSARIHPRPVRRPHLSRPALQLPPGLQRPLRRKGWQPLCLPDHRLQGHLGVERRSRPLLRRGHRARRPRSLRHAMATRRTINSPTCSEQVRLHAEAIMAMAISIWQNRNLLHQVRGTNREIR